MLVRIWWDAAHDLRVRVVELGVPSELLSFLLVRVRVSHLSKSNQVTSER